MLVAEDFVLFGTSARIAAILQHHRFSLALLLFLIMTCLDVPEA